MSGWFVEFSVPGQNVLEWKTAPVLLNSVEQITEPQSEKLVHRNIIPYIGSHRCTNKCLPETVSNPSPWSQKKLEQTDGQI